MPRPSYRAAPKRRTRAAPAAEHLHNSHVEATDSAHGPQKIHKILAAAGLGSRREMEELIRAGKVKVNGVLARVGMRVRPGDLIKVGRRQVTVRDSSGQPRIIA